MALQKYDENELFEKLSEFIDINPVITLVVLITPEGLPITSITKEPRERLDSSTLINYGAMAAAAASLSVRTISTLSTMLPFENRLVAHTSGSVNIHDLDKKNRRGVFYPLQTFSKEVPIDFNDVPICLEALDKNDLDILIHLAEAIGSPWYKISTEQRQTLHVAAVFVNNFTNQLYRIAHEISDAKNINFEILKPLISETAKKIQEVSPYMAQTGPAKRNDKKTIKKHLKLLEKENHKAIYELLTESIKKTHGVSSPRRTTREKSK